MKPYFTLIFSLFSFFFSTEATWAAPCCARNAATPALIVGDDQTQVNLGFSLAHVVADATEDGALVFNSPNYSDISQVHRFDFSTMVSDRLQFGSSFNLVRHTVRDSELSETQLGVGDTRLNVGYELLPVWNYSKWKPQIFIFSTFTFPTGRSKYEFERPLLSDVTGNGFYSVSMGGLILKRWGIWDIFLLPEIHFAFPRTFETEQGNLKVYPRLGGSFGVGAGWSPGNGPVRLGLRIQPRLDQTTVTVLGDQISGSQGMLSVCDTGFDAALLISSTDSLMVSYTDQTLLGVATNLNVNRTLALNFQHRWER